VGKFLPLLSLPGNYLGFLIWSRLSRSIGGIVLSRGPQPISDAETARRLKKVFIFLAVPWVVGLGTIAGVLYLQPGTLRGWFWLVVGAAIVPLFVAVTFGRVLRKMRTSSVGMRSNTSLERSRDP